MTTFSIKRASNVNAASIATILGYTVVRGAVGGVIQQGDVNGTTGLAGAARIRPPRGLDLDESGNLYFTDSHSSNCKVQVVNLSAAPLQFFGAAVHVPASEVGNLVGINCASLVAGTYSAVKVVSPIDVAVHGNGLGGVAGISIAAYSNNSIMYVNNQWSTVTIGRRSIMHNQGALIFGNQFPGYNGDSQSGMATRLSGPIGLMIDGTQLLVLEL